VARVVSADAIRGIWNKAEQDDGDGTPSPAWTSPRGVRTCWCKSDNGAMLLLPSSGEQKLLEAQLSSLHAPPRPRSSTTAPPETFKFFVGPASAAVEEHRASSARCQGRGHRLREPTPGTSPRSAVQCHPDVVSRQTHPRGPRSLRCGWSSCGACQSFSLASTT
jgi:hypothetical protein